MTVSLRAYLNTYNHQVNLLAWIAATNLQPRLLLETEQISTILVPHPTMSSNGLLTAHKLRESRLVRVVRQEALSTWQFAHYMARARCAIAVELHGVRLDIR